MRRKFVATSKTFAFALALALLSVMAGPVLAQQAGRKYALLVGVEHYDPQFFNQLAFAEDDVLELGALLESLGYDVIAMTRRSVIPARVPNTAQKILDQLTRRTQKVEKSDTLVVFLSGHGVQFKGDRPLADGSRESYFCPEEADLTKRGTLIPISRVIKTLADSVAERKLLVVDACRNEAVAEPAKAAKEIELEPAGRNMRTVPRGMLALFSCADLEKSFEDPGLKHGVFAYHLLKYLKGDGGPYPRDQLSLVEMANYARRETSDFVFRKLNKDQSPVLLSPTGLTDWPLGKITGRTLTNSLGMKLALLSAGEFEMGSPAGEAGRGDDEVPAHRVRITRPFYLGAHEVSVLQFRQFVEQDGYRTEAENDGRGGWGFTQSTGQFEQKPEYSWRNPGFTQQDDHPVVNVSWNDARAFCQWLRRKDNRAYRLPTEAEWEYAARAGARTRFTFGDDPEMLATFGNVADATAKEKFSGWTTIAAADGHVFTSPVGSFASNAWNLHDMHGNVWEWCSDWYDAKYYAKSPLDDPSGPATGAHRVHRGGGWLLDASHSRAAARSQNSPSYRNLILGFRVACDPQ